jgi:nucleotide-binding universal stress UspA family protein
VPLDGSEYSEYVLEQVKEMAVNCHIKEIIILYVVEPLNPALYEVPSQIIDDAYSKGKNFGRAYLDRIVAKLQAEGVAAPSVRGEGKVGESILDYVGKNGVDLIAMSTHGRSGLTRWMIGSVADKIVQNSTVPVLLVRPPNTKEGKK